jgi:DNA invertase Pin-like site-specific DNA recombinase
VPLLHTVEIKNKTTMAKKPTLKKLIELAGTYAGCVQDIARACDVTRQTVHEWQQKHPEFKEAIANGNDVLVDLALTGLKHLLEQKSERSVHYTLDRLARNKGFGMMLQVTDKSKLDEQLETMTDADIVAEMERSLKRIKNG